MIENLIIGCAQFGQPYGITNNGAQISLREVDKILTESARLGINRLDTASSYGQSEEIVGSLGSGAFSIMGKLPAIKVGFGKDQIFKYFHQNAIDSLRKLNKSQFHTLYLHNTGDLTGDCGHHVYDALLNLCDSGLTKNIGISIYSPACLEAIPASYRFDVVQAPLNVFDRRIVESGWVERLNRSGTKVIARSVFLQGLLLQEIGSIPQPFINYLPSFREWHRKTDQLGISRLQGCLSSVLKTPGIDGAIIGLNSFSHFKDLVEEVGRLDDVPSFNFSVREEALLDPRKWSI